MPTITLDQIRADIEALYAPVVIDIGDGVTCTLVQAIRLPKERRAELIAAQKETQLGELADGDDVDLTESRSLSAMRTIIRIVATNKAEADALLAKVGDDLVILSGVLRAYAAETQLPEASASAS